MKKKSCSWPVYVCIIVMVSIGCYYVSLSSRDVVFMDVWRIINHLIPAVENGEDLLSNLWYQQGAQRNPLFLAIVAFNIKFLKLNCLWEEYAGIFAIGLTTLVLYANWNKVCIRRCNINSICSNLLFLPVIFTLFSLNQWEILSLQFSFAFMLRIFAYTLTFLLLDNMFQDESVTTIKAILFGVAIGIIVDLISQLYMVAYLLTILTTWIVELVRKKEKFKQYMIPVIAFWIPVLLSLVIYFSGLSAKEFKGDCAGEPLQLLLSPNYYYGILYMLVGSLFPQTKIELINRPVILSIGFVLLLIVVLAVALYFKYRLQSTTYFPMMLCAYGLFSIAVIVAGRVQRFGLYGVVASRYVCETILLWCGCILTLLTIAMTSKKEKKQIVLYAISAAIILLIGYADFIEFHIAPYRGWGKDQMLQMLDAIDSYSDDELTVFQAGNPDLVRTGIALMEKYSLNYFRYPRKAADEQIGSTLATCRVLKGVFDDGWLEREAKLMIQTGKTGVLHLSGYYPKYKQEGEKITIWQDGSIVTEYLLDSELFEFDVVFEPNEVVCITIEPNFAFQADPPDERELSFILADLHAKGTSELNEKQSQKKYEEATELPDAA